MIKRYFKIKDFIFFVKIQVQTFKLSSFYGMMVEIGTKDIISKLLDKVLAFTTIVRFFKF